MRGQKHRRLDVDLEKMFAQAGVEIDERRRQWERKHGNAEALAVLYLQLKPNALARGRLTVARAAQIEDIVAWTFAGPHTDTDLEQVLDELMRLERMEAVDRSLQHLA